jgi:hypothetical protein
LGPNGTLNVQVAGRGGVPSSGVSAVVVNVTVTDTTAPSFLTVWPTGAARPLASTLNWVPGSTVPNMDEVALGAGGQLSIYNLTGQADIVMDVEGWVGDSTNSYRPLGMYNPLTPSRLLDTRSGNGAPVAPVGQGETINLQVTGRGGVPSSGVSAVALNVTVTDTSAPSYLTVWPAGQPRPLASNLNWSTGQTLPNRVMVQLDSSGQVSIYNNTGSTDVVVDVNGWFTDSTNVNGGSGFVATVPTRVLDTRTKSPLGPGASRYLTLLNQLPMTAAAMNATVTNTTSPGYMTLWPSDQPQPFASDLNWVAGETVANMAVVKLGYTSDPNFPSGYTKSGTFSFFNQQGQTDLVIDVIGFYTATVQPAATAAVTSTTRPGIAASSAPAVRVSP